VLAAAPLAVATTGRATTTGAEIPTLRVAVQQISENRNTSGQGSINLNLVITADDMPPTAAVRQVVVTKAADNQDRPLTPMAGRGGSMSPMALSNSISNALSRGGRGAPSMTATANLGGSVRNAESVKYAEGTIEVFLPTEANGAIIRIPNIKAHPGRIEHPTLAKYGITFIFMADKASTDEALAARGQLGGSLNSTTDGVSGYGYYYRDPQNVMGGVVLLDGTGTPVRGGGGGGGGGTSGTLMSYSLTSGGPMGGGPLTDAHTLVIYLAVPEALVKVPFRVDDIALP
jgi:hypothetical protein